MSQADVLAWGVHMRAAICDDDKIWLDRASDIFCSCAKKRGLEPDVFLFSDPEELLAYAGEVPDILFMDIVLKNERNGIQTVKEINALWPQCQVIYLTNYLYYAVDVYETEHIWFLQKSRFEEKLDLVLDRVGQEKEKRRQKLVLTTLDRKTCSIPCGNVLYMERSGRVTTVVTSEGNYLVREKLPELLDRLPEDRFLRCHNSYVVALPAVMHFTKDIITMSDGSVILISRGYRKSFLEGFLRWAADQRPI